MSRLPLIHIPNGLYSVVSKCNNDEFHFDSSEKFNLYLSHLLECKRKLKFKMYDICCMSNHVHELYEVPADVTIAQILHTVKGHFSRKYNRIFQRKGHFWKNKPFYRIVQDERYAIASCNYFHYNPVKAGIVRHPSEWPYSGYRFHVLDDKTGILGRILDPLPGTTSQEWLLPNPLCLSQTVKILQQIKGRYIGDSAYIRNMRCSLPCQTLGAVGVRHL